MMIKKNSTREIIRQEAVRAAARLYSAENYRRWQTNKVYPNQIQSVYKSAYKELGLRHPKMQWLKLLTTIPSKDIELKLVLRIPEKDIEIDLPDSDRKLGAIAHAGGVPLLLELLEILQSFGKTAFPAQEMSIDDEQMFDKAMEFMDGDDEH
jgi:hypothetical protein